MAAHVGGAYDILFIHDGEVECHLVDTVNSFNYASWGLPVRPLALPQTALTQTRC